MSHLTEEIGRTTWEIIRWRHFMDFIIKKNQSQTSPVDLSSMLKYAIYHMEIDSSEDWWWKHPCLCYKFFRMEDCCSPLQTFTTSLDGASGNQWYPPNSEICFYNGGLRIMETCIGSTSVVLMRIATIVFAQNSRCVWFDRSYLWHYGVGDSSKSYGVGLVYNWKQWRISLTRLVRSGNQIIKSLHNHLLIDL